jgi:hypothetical protein
MYSDPSNWLKLLTEVVRLAIVLIELIKNWPKGPRT